MVQQEPQVLQEPWVAAQRPPGVHPNLPGLESRKAMQGLPGLGSHAQEPRGPEQELKPWGMKHELEPPGGEAGTGAMGVRA